MMSVPAIVTETFMSGAAVTSSRMSVVGLVDQPAPNERESTQEATRTCASRMVNGRLTTNVATIGDTAMQPIVVKANAPTLVKPLALSQPF
jgi:hypothetical protein